MNNSIVVEKADNALRDLKKGWGWQMFRVYAIRTCSKDEFSKVFGNKKKAMVEAQGKWEQEIVGFINRRASQLGMQIAGIQAQLVEQPNESSFMEMAIWEDKDLLFIWSIWAYLRGPLEKSAITVEPKPLFMFWPNDVYKWNKGIPEIMDSRKLSQRHEDA